MVYDGVLYIMEYNAICQQPNCTILVLGLFSLRLVDGRPIVEQMISYVC